MKTYFLLIAIVLFISHDVRAWGHITIYNGGASGPRINCKTIFLENQSQSYGGSTVTITTSPTTVYAQFKADKNKSPLGLRFLKYVELFRRIIYNPDLMWLSSETKGKSFISDIVIKDFAEDFNNMSIPFKDSTTSLDSNEVYFYARLAQVKLFNKYYEYDEVHSIESVILVLKNLYRAVDHAKKYSNRKILINDSFTGSIFDQYIQSAFSYFRNVRPYFQSKKARTTIEGVLRKEKSNLGIEFIMDLEHGVDISLQSSYIERQKAFETVVAILGISLEYKEN